MFKKRKKEALTGVKRKAAVTAAQRLALEKEMLLSGKKPKSIFSSAQQRTAVRLLSGFFAMMLIFTILSRIATDLTIAKVRTDTVKPGVLVQSYSIPGTLEARDTLDVVLPGNIRISNRMVQEGDCVDAGDEILKLDLDSIQTVTEQLENEINILNLKIDNLSCEMPGADTKMLQLAENNLRYAQAEQALREAEEALASLGEGVAEEERAAAQERADTARSQKETVQVQADQAARSLSDAEDTLAWTRENLERIQAQQDQLVSEAQDDVWDAENQLNDTKNQTDFSNESLVSAALANADAARSGLDAAVREWENESLSGEEQVMRAQRAIETAAIELESVKEALERAKQSDAATRRQNEAERLQYESELREKQAALEEIRQIGAQDGVITAPVDGTVKSVTEAFVTQDNGAVLTLSRADQGWDSGNFPYAPCGMGKDILDQLSSRRHSVRFNKLVFVACCQAVARSRAKKHPPDQPDLVGRPALYHMEKQGFPGGKPVYCIMDTSDGMDGHKMAAGSSCRVRGR